MKNSLFFSGIVIVLTVFAACDSTENQSYQIQKEDVETHIMKLSSD